MKSTAIVTWQRNLARRIVVDDASSSSILFQVNGWLSQEAGSTSAPVKGFRTYESNEDRSVLAALLSWLNGVLVKVNMPSPLIQHYFPPKYHLDVDPKSA